MRQIADRVLRLHCARVFANRLGKLSVFAAIAALAVASSPANAFWATLAANANPNDGDFTLTWYNNSGDPYSLQRRPSGGSWSTITTTYATSRSFLGHAAGDFSFRLRRTYETCSGWPEPECFNVTEYSETIVVTVNAPPPPPPPSGGGDPFPAPGPFTPPSAANFPDQTVANPSLPTSDDVGALQGSGGVSGGQASYSIPIVIPPGRKGMQPSVSLNYSSSGGNGVVGVGWGLSAGSSISRCSATVAQDGFTAAVQYDLSRDRVCLDGMRLMVVSGAYGASGSQYRTELDSFTRITLFNGDLNSTAGYFYVERKDGSTARYGYTSTSRHKAGGRNETLTWAISDVFDRPGNFIHFDYSSYGTGEYLLSAINYTGRSNAPGDRHVRFEYKPLDYDQARTYYRAGGKTRSTQRLKSITTEYQSTLIRKYSLNYLDSPYSGRNRLDSVQECAYENGVTPRCLPATTFEWQESGQDFLAEELTFFKNGAPTKYLDNVEHLDLIVPRGDRNGDGVKDWQGVQVNAEGEVDKEDAIDLGNCFRAPNTLRLTCLSADFNADGLTDAFRRNGNVLQTKINSPTALWMSTGIAWNSNYLAAAGDAPLAFADFNGDGWVDLAMKTGGQIRVYFHTTSMTVPYNSSNYQAVYTFTTSAADVQIYGDMDGNGTPDFTVSTVPGANDIPGLPTPDEFLLTTSTTGGGMTITPRSVPSYKSIKTAINATNANFFHDVNGDGLQDLLSLKEGTNNYLQYKLNTGSGFEANWVLTDMSIPVRLTEFVPVLNEVNDAAYPIMSMVLVMDYDGDGRDDILTAGQIMASSCTEVMEVGIGLVWKCDDDLYGTYKNNMYAAVEEPINASSLDNSVRKYNGLRFVETASGLYDTQGFATDIVASASQTAVVDATGDGLPDIVTAFGCRGNPACQFNGNTYSTGASWQGTYTSGLYTATGAWINRNLGTASNDPNNAVFEYAAYDLMSAVEDGFGNRREWDYRPLSSDAPDTPNSDYYVADQDADLVKDDPDYFYFASSMYVVSEHRQSDGLGGMNSSLYRYRSAMYNNKGRGFQGFLSIITEEDIFAATHSLANTDKISRTDFYQIWPLSSHVQQSCTWLTVDNKTDDNPTCGGSISHVTANPPYDVATVGGARFVAASGQTSNQYDLTSRDLLTSKVSTVSYDTYGNVTSQSQSHVDDWTSNLTTTTSSFTISTAAWWINKLDSRTVTQNPVSARHSTSPNVLASQDAVKSVTTDFLQYDTAKRLPTKITVSGNDTALTSTVDTLYNSAGLPITVTTTGTDVTGPRIQTIIYTENGTTLSAFGYFPLKITNTLGHSVTTHYDPAHGQAIDVTDPNGLVATTVYDAFGRATDVTGPGVPTVSTRLRWCNSGVWCLAGAMYRVQTISAAAPTNYSYADSFGRTIYVISRNFKSTGWTRVRNTFDVRGNPILQSVPFDTTVGDPVYPGTRYDSYDALGRLTQKRTDQANGSKLTTTYSYAGFTTNIIAGGISMSRTYNGLGQLVETQDGIGGFTRYAFDGAGNPIVLQDPKMDAMGPTISIKAAFNSLGQKQWVEDPDWWNTPTGGYGQKTFTYSALGEVLSEADPNGNLVVMDYDVLGRLLTRTVNGDIEGLWAYDNTDTYKGLGLLDYEDSQFQADGSRLQKFYYYGDGTNGRKDLLQVTHRIYENEDPNGVVFEFEDYDTAYFTDTFYARPKGLQYPGGTSVALIYDGQGNLVEEKDPITGAVYRQITAKGSKNEVLNANVGKHGGVYQYTFVATTYGATGQSQSITVSNSTSTLQDLDYSYDGFGNLETRSNTHAAGITTETLSYDNLQRLTLSQRVYDFGPGNDNVSYSYDESGNFESKSDFANTYSYHASRPHVLTGVSGGISYTFDDNGNVTSGDNENISYNAFNKPLRIENIAQSLTSTFSYGADLMRYRQETPQGTTIYYIDKLMEIEASASNTDYRHYLGDVAVLTKTGSLNDPNPGIKYLLRDRLGSVAVIGDTSGFSVETRGSDAFGKPRNGDWTDKTPAIIGSSITDRGFTDHEHLDDWELIHMNGRGYDYNLGRFLSIDPFIQTPGNSQAINPYTYIGNNPLSGTDPTGYAGVSEKDKVDGDAANEGSLVAGTTSQGSTIVATQITEKVAVTGSRIKRHTKTTTSGVEVSTDGRVRSFSKTEISNGTSYGGRSLYKQPGGSSGNSQDQLGSLGSNAASPTINVGSAQAGINVSSSQMSSRTDGHVTASTAPENLDPVFVALVSLIGVSGVHQGSLLLRLVENLDARSRSRFYRPSEQAMLLVQMRQARDDLQYQALKAIAFQIGIVVGIGEGAAYLTVNTTLRQRMIACVGGGLLACASSFGPNGYQAFSGGQAAAYARAANIRRTVSRDLENARKAFEIVWRRMQ